MKLAVITDVFPGTEGGDRLAEVLGVAVGQGAGLALLPELPFSPWVPATREPRPEDAEPPDGPAQQAMRAAARQAGISVLGGALVATPAGRRSVALLYDANGECRLRYEKLHLPSEEGFWESDHYDPGDRLPEVVEVAGMPLGVQICSDVNRHQVAHILAAQGAELILVPRATPLATYERWRLVLRSLAVTTAAYVASVNRPGPEGPVPIGGPSLVFGPDGTVHYEGTDALAVVDLDRALVNRFRTSEYPGYLSQRAGLYTEGWRRVAEAAGTPTPGDG